MSQTWRLIVDTASSGALNMARDEALHQLFRRPGARPILRFYGWQPACLSIGYAQPAAEVNWAACQTYGIDVVRRPSGGRAVLHDHELTYAVIAAADDAVVGGSLALSYQTIANGLVSGLLRHGIIAELAPGRPQGDRAARRSGACFTATTRSEIVWQGRKLVGSAQLRRQGVLLQHGSILLAPGRVALGHLLRNQAAALVNDDLERGSTTIASIVALTASASTDIPAPPPMAQDAPSGAPSPPTAVGSPPLAATQLADVAAFAAAFAARLGIDLAASTLTDDEHALATNLVTTRYAAHDWTLRR